MMESKKGYNSEQSSGEIYPLDKSLVSLKEDDITYISLSQVVDITQNSLNEVVNISQNSIKVGDIVTISDKSKVYITKTRHDQLVSLEKNLSSIIGYSVEEAVSGLGKKRYETRKRLL